jgi:ubiquinone/menaquinone biosynthesis C-methylase UbiE
MKPELVQKELYDRIASDHQAHYDDEASRRFRDTFIYPHLLGGIDFSGARVLEAMCGSGQVTRQLLGRGAFVVGLDVSQSQLELFRRKFPQCATVCASVTDLGFEDASFDHVVVMGGLHHTHPRLEETIVEIHRVLKPGGCLCFSEPHTGSLPDAARKLWYRIDPLFLPNEASLDFAKLKRTFADRFTFGPDHYLGSIGYLLIFNSLVLRVPLWLKRAYSPAFMRVERALSALLCKQTSCFMVSQWRKR